MSPGVLLDVKETKTTQWRSHVGQNRSHRKKTISNLLVGITHENRLQPHYMSYAILPLLVKK